MHVAWTIDERTYVLLKTFRRWRQAKREADKVERWYRAQGIDVQVKIIKEICDNGETQKTFANISTMPILRHEDYAATGEKRSIPLG